jgi:hypothetical protein
MNKVINVDDILAYKEAVKRLKEHKIQFDRKKLLDDPELSREIVRLINYYSNERIDDEEL